MTIRRHPVRCTVSLVISRCYAHHPSAFGANCVLPLVECGVAPRYSRARQDDRESTGADLEWTHDSIGSLCGCDAEWSIHKVAGVEAASCGNVSQSTRVPLLQTSPVCELCEVPLLRIVC